MSGLRRGLGAVLVAVLLPLAPAAADVAGPDDSIAQAFGPLAPGAIYNGTFKSETDTDYLAFDVAAGQTLHFEVANTVERCTSPFFTGCPLYATLIDEAGGQLGGEGSSAGTGPLSTYWPSEPIDWQFETGGRYFVAMDSDGDSPSYAIAYAVVPPGAGADAGTGAGAGAPGAGGGGGSEPGNGADAGSATSSVPPVAVILTRRQRGSVVRAEVNVGRRLSRLTLRLERPGSNRTAPPLGATRIGAVEAGSHVVGVRLEPAARRRLSRRGRLSLRLRVVADPASGPTQSLVRRVTLLRP